MGQPTLAQYAESTFSDSGTTDESVAGISWLAGDIILVFGTESNNESGTNDTLATPTATGLTFSLVGSVNTTLQSTGDDCVVYLWSATAASPGSSTVTVVTNSTNTNLRSGASVFVFRGSAGLGTPVILDGSSAKTINLTRVGNNSHVIVALSDFSEVGVGTIAATPTGTVRHAQAEAGQADFYVLSFGDQGAPGTTAYGYTNSIGTTPRNSGIAIEILGIEVLDPSEFTKPIDLTIQADWKVQRWDLPLETDLLLDDFMPSAGGPAAINASAALQDQADAAAGAVALAIGASAAIMDLPDSVAASATLAVAASGAIVDAPDLIAATGGAVGINADAAPKDAPDIVAGAASVPIAASSALQEGPNTVSAAASLAVSANSALQDVADTVAAAVTLAIGVSSALKDLADTLSSTSALAISITAAPQDQPDLVAGVGGAAAAVADSALKEAPDTVAASSGLTISGTANVNDLADRISAATVSIVGITGSLQDQLDRVAMSAVAPASVSSALVDTGDGLLFTLLVARNASAALVEADLQLLASGALAIAANFTGRDAADLVRVGAVLMLVETAGGYVAELILPAREFAFNAEARLFDLSAESKTFNLSVDARIFPLVKP